MECPNCKCKLVISVADVEMRPPEPAPGKTKLNAWDLYIPDKYFKYF